jgi:hypothetical protein
MRTKHVVVCLAAVLLVAQGCDWIEKIKGPSRPPQQFSERPTAPQLISYLNDNARKIDSLQVRDLDMDAGREKGLGSNLPVGVGIDGTLVCQRPRNFRLEAYAPASRSLEADIGSNDQEFWFYVKQSKPPYLFHCSHNEMTRAQLPFPFHPDWVLDALGMTVINSPENFDVRIPSRGNTIELVEKSRTPQGQPVYKVTVFNRHTAVGAEPQVVERKIVDSRGKEIFRAEIKQMQTLPGGVVVPQKVVLHTEEMRLALTLNGASANAALDQNFVQEKFSRPSYQGVQPFDLARRGGDSFSPSSDLRPAGAYRGSRR